MESTAEQQFKQRRARSVFKFFDGAKERKVDAWKVFILLRDVIPLQMAQINAASGSDILSLVDHVRKILDVPKWTPDSEGGLNDSEMVGVIQDLMNFVEGQKKSTASDPISQPSTVPGSWGDPGPSSSVSGST